MSTQPLHPVNHRRVEMIADVIQQAIDQIAVMLKAPTIEVFFAMTAALSRLLKRGEDAVGRAGVQDLCQLHLNTLALDLPIVREFLAEPVAATYVGRRLDGDRVEVVCEPIIGVVTSKGQISERGLRPRYDLQNHSPDGFEWGYGGSGPAQLALAIVADATRSDEIARQLHSEYHLDVVSVLPREGFRIPRIDVLRWVEQHYSDALAERIGAALLLRLVRDAQIQEERRDAR